MKKKHVLIAVILVVIVFAAGVFARDIVRVVRSEIREEFTDNKYAQNNTKPTTSSEKIDPKAVVDNSNGADKQNKQQEETMVEDGYIGEEKAKEIALDKAGLKESEVSFVRVELDMDNGIVRYEVEFRQGYKEYSAEIKADDGKVLDWEVDIDD